MTRQLPLKLKLAAHTRLDDYVGCAAERLQNLEGLILLSGGAGTGKSHLLQGLCHLAESDHLPAIYLAEPAELKAEVLNALEAARLICLDDIDQVIASADWQQALFHLINGCRDKATTLVLSSTIPLHTMTGLLPDLASRLRAAYRVESDVLDDSEKLEVIRCKAARRGFEMPAEVCRFILSRAPRDMHHLSDLVMRLDEESLIRQKKVTIPFVKSALGL